ncbi:MAG: hypothetical protein P1V97_16835 [Planctomycetota bacterium]|nr:hypothetical protein [Planctomycetota bacterium]
MVLERPTVKTLRTLIERRVRPKTFTGPLYKTGISALDQQLPGGALKPGTLIEIFSRQSLGAGAWRLAFLILTHIAKEGPSAYLDRHPKIYPPALAAMGVDLERLLIVKPPSHRLALWSLEQLSLSSSFHLSIASVPRLKAPDLRRFQLGLEQSERFLILLRPWEEQAWKGTGASLRLAVESAQGSVPKATVSECTRSLTLNILRGPGRRARPVLMELNGVTGTLSSSAVLSR